MKQIRISLAMAEQFITDAELRANADFFIFIKKVDNLYHNEVLDFIGLLVSK